MKVHADVKDLLQELLKADVSVENEEHQKWLEFCQATNKNTRQYYRNTMRRNLR